MSRQNEKNLLVTVAAFATTALLVVVFNSSAPDSVQSPSRARRDDGETDADPELPCGGIWDFSNVECTSGLYDSMVEIDIEERAYGADLLKAGRGKGKGKGKGNKGGGGGGVIKFNAAKIKAEQIDALKPQMEAAFRLREEALVSFNTITGSSFAQGNPDFSKPGDEEYNYPGYGETSPAVQRFIDEFQCADNTYFSDGAESVNVYFMLPVTMPLFEADPVASYANYVNFISKLGDRAFPTAAKNKNFRYTLGQYSNWVKFASSKKFKNGADFKASNSKYSKPMMTASQPTLFKALKNAGSQIRVSSSPTMGENCMLVMFFHDIPKDLEEFENPDSVATLEALHDKCTVVPIFISPTTSSNRAEWTKLGAQLVPGRQLQYGKDNDYDGIFYASSMEDLGSNDQLVSHLSNYFCLAKNRCLCRIKNDGFVFPASEVPATTGGTTTEEPFRAVEEDYDEAEPTTAGVAATDGTTTTDNATEGTAGPTPKVAVVDSCCGHGAYTSIAYDSELKTCCEDGSSKPYMEDGSDPCA